MTEKEKTESALLALDNEFHLYPYIRYAIEKLGFREKTYMLPQTLLFRLCENRFDSNVLKELVDNILSYLGIPFMAKFKGVKVLKTPADGGVHKIGSYGNAGNIEMMLYEHHTAEQILALAIHECAHAYLDFQGFAPGGDATKNEILTEVAAIYLGFGIYLKTGYALFVSGSAVEDEKKINISRLSHRVGYIAAAEVTEVMDEFAAYIAAYKK